MVILCLPFIGWAQDTITVQHLNDSISPRTKHIPLTREQAKVLVTSIVRAQLEKTKAQERLDSAVLAVQIEAIKRKLIDRALEQLYGHQQDTRLDRLEYMIYAMANQQGIDLPYNYQPNTSNHIILDRDGESTTTYISSPAGNVWPVIPPSPTTTENTNPTDKSMEVTNLRPKTQGLSQDSMNGETTPDSVNDSLMRTSIVTKQPSSLTVPEARPATKPMIVTVPSTQPPERTNWSKIQITSIVFDIGSATLNTNARLHLDDFIRNIRDNHRVHLSIKGFASYDGNIKTNNRLSAQRAQAVADYLKSHGISENKIQVHPSGIDSMSTPEMARRVDIVPVYGNIK